MVTAHAEDIAAVSTTAMGSGAWDAKSAAFVSHRRHQEQQKHDDYEVSGAGGAKATAALLLACLATLLAL